MKHRLIVYAKCPLPGYAKTRLGTDIGTEQAAGVYARLLYSYLLNLLRAGLEDTCIELSVAALADVPFFTAAFPELVVQPQVAGDLGARMTASFSQAFAAGAQAAVLTGSDIPGLDSHLVCDAFEVLAEAPIVIGPARDGGYYLIGMRAPGFALFDGIEWSTQRVLAQTEALAQSQGLPLAHLCELDDIDTGKAFERWRQVESKRR